MLSSYHCIYLFLFILISFFSFCFIYVCLCFLLHPLHFPVRVLFVVSIERGRELFLNGRDGTVYKGRDPSSVTLISNSGMRGSGTERNSNFQVHYTDRMSGNQHNPRGNAIVDQKTVSAAAHINNGSPPSPSHAQTPQRAQSAAFSRPSTAPYDSPSGLLARRSGSSQGDSLPPTRPATRSGGRTSRLAASVRDDEEPTPLRQELAASAF